MTARATSRVVGALIVLIVGLVGLAPHGRADDAVPAAVEGSGSGSGSAVTTPFGSGAPPAVEPAPVAPAAPKSDEGMRAFAGSIQLDYLAVPTDRDARTSTFDGATAEVSLKVTKDFSRHASATVKVCFACHGFELGLGYVELRATDELRVRVGRMLPSFGAFPARHDPANHLTSDKPLPYDMGRMLARETWNEGILPAPWVDNGIELAGTRFWDSGRIDYAAFLVSGPKGSPDAVDFDFTLSRAPEQYYVDNNSQPAIGGRLSGTFDFSERVSVSVGASAMAGHYDPERNLGFAIGGVDASVTVDKLVVRGEYLLRRTEMAPGSDPGMRFKYVLEDTYFVKDGFYVEGELPVGPVTAIARWDGLRRDGNLLVTSPLSSRSSVLRYTGGLAVKLPSKIQVKTSIELYQFSELDDELAIHLGIATAF